MSFRKYDHVERFGHSDVEGLNIGMVHVFPKLDGTCGSAWMDDEGTIHTASRRRVVTVEDDNQGFAKWFDDNQGKFEKVWHDHPTWILYGEWMIPHTLKTYRKEAWRRFWVFDVFDLEAEMYVLYETYAPVLQACVSVDPVTCAKIPIDVIEPLCTIDNPSEEQMRAQVETNTYLIADGAGLGEGVVFKNYAWENQFGRQPWMKIVRNEFKEDAQRVHGTTHKHGEFQVEAAIAEEYCTPELVGKTRAKVVADVANQNDIDLMEPNAQQMVEADYRGRVIPQLLGRVWHDVITESSWDMIKKHKNPVIDFTKLKAHCVAATKKFAEDLF